LRSTRSTEADSVGISDGLNPVRHTSRSIVGEIACGWSI
jgi:hypothetical protein